MPRHLPILQGDIEGLCGIYAIVNALGSLFNLSKKDKGELVEDLVSFVGNEFTQMFLKGCDFAWLKALALQAKKYCSSQHIEFTIEAGKFSDITRKDKYFNRLDNELNGDTRAIIGIEGVMAHWTVCISLERDGKAIDNKIKTLSADREKLRTAKKGGVQALTTEIAGLTLIPGPQYKRLKLIDSSVKTIPYSECIVTGDSGANEDKYCLVSKEVLLIRKL